jgi:deoxyribodipyrimidine photo-lyase
MVSVFWFRRDLRLEDNAGLYHALKGPYPVLAVFIFDRIILDKLPEKDDPRVSFIHQSLHHLQQQLQTYGSSLKVYYGTPDTVWKTILETHPVGAVYANEDYEPYAIQRDEDVRKLIGNVPFHRFKDQVIFGKNEVLKDDGKPYTVFTPYSRKWKSVAFSKLNGVGSEYSYYLKSYPTKRYLQKLLPMPAVNLPTLESMGFTPTKINFPPAIISRQIISRYETDRNFPALPGTSRLGIHFRFGTISIREKAKHAISLSAHFLNELIWRDFYSQILAHFPHVAERAFKPDYDRIQWRNNTEDYNRWCSGTTGYPIVDAGMRELNATGFMHNRVRMITASFLTKHLLIDWRAGEKYFANKLLDFDLASNSGGWQWAAGCGTDAAPYFRIFNPYEQTKKFDAKLEYVRKWVPEFESPEYPKPMVDHVFARNRCLETYKNALSKT